MKRCVECNDYFDTLVELELSIGREKLYKYICHKCFEEMKERRINMDFKKISNDSYRMKLKK